jgi:hypothetical protein
MHKNSIIDLSASINLAIACNWQLPYKTIFIYNIPVKKFGDISIIKLQGIITSDESLNLFFTSIGYSFFYT